MVDVIEHPELGIYIIKFNDGSEYTLTKDLFDKEQKYKIVEIIKSNYPDESIKDKKLDKLREIIINEILSDEIKNIKNIDNKELKELVESYLYVLNHLKVIDYNGMELKLPKLPDKIDDVHYLYILLYQLQGNFKYLNKLEEVIKKCLSNRELTPQELNEWTDTVNEKIKDLKRKILKLAIDLKKMKTSENYDEHVIKILEQSYRTLKNTYEGYKKSLQMGEHQAIQWLMTAAKSQLEKLQTDISLAKYRLQDLINFIKYKINVIVELGGLPVNIMNVALNIGKIAFDAVANLITGQQDVSIPLDELDRDIEELRKELEPEVIQEKETVEMDQEKK